MLATSIAATGTKVSAWPVRDSLALITARSFLQNRRSTRRSVAGLTFQVSPGKWETELTRQSCGA